MVDEGVASDGIGTLHWYIAKQARTTLSNGGKASEGVEHH
jgi:hypothetical protein